ncbi:MAG: GNAT family N-acetyltransferase [Armatimonadetes bacterium]|nr:GNAT family N-acetyltransferase [Armatimonadota bacterium]
MGVETWNQRLSTGEELEIARLVVPCDDWAPRLLDFMYVRHPEYTNCNWHLNCKRVLGGEFGDVSHDVFYAGLLGGEIVGTAWYGAPRDTLDVATFGRVITAREHRRKGIASVLSEAAVEDFRELGGWCMHLGTGLTNPARFIYEKLGFAHCNFAEGGGTIMRNVLRGDPARFEEEYFEPGWATTLRDLHWGDLARAEVLYNLPRWFVKDATLGIYANTPFEGQFFDLMTGLEQRRARGKALVTEQGRLVGLAYPAATGAGAGAQDHLRVIEFLVHPWYADSAATLVGSCVAECQGLRLLAYASALDVTRCEVLEEAGFQREAALAGCLQDDESEFDLYIYGYAE